jgi:hypothetical protein
VDPLGARVREPADGAATGPAELPAEPLGVRSQGRRSGRVVVGALLAAALLTGCGLVTGLIHTQSELEQAGYGNAVVNFHTTGTVTTVVVTADRSPSAGAAQAKGAAAVVWHSLPGSFQKLQVTIGGTRTVVYDEPRLEAMFGARPETLDQQSLSGEAANSGAAILAVTIGVLLLVTVAVVVLVVVVRRRRRKAQRSRTALLMATIPQELWGVADPKLGWSGPAGPTTPSGPPAPAGQPAPAGRPAPTGAPPLGGPGTPLASMGRPVRPPTSPPPPPPPPPPPIAAWPGPTTPAPPPPPSPPDGRHQS